MDDESIIHTETITTYTHQVDVSVGGYQLQIWPLSWAFLASLAAVLFIGLLTLAVVVYGARRDHDAKHR